MAGKTYNRCTSTSSKLTDRLVANVSVSALTKGIVLHRRNKLHATMLATFAPKCSTTVRHQPCDL